MSYQPRYSGPNRSGICKCGHSWEDHHLCCVMNREYAEATGEAYLPQECEAYGPNELGGLQPVDGEWVDHCHSYTDSMEAEFCLYCGAGIGKFRREGEGTCPKCNPAK